MAMISSTRNCYLCNKPLDEEAYCTVDVRCGIVIVHDECIKAHNRMLSREAFLRATNRRIQSKTP
jgi:hypothetical protein